MRKSDWKPSKALPWNPSAHPDEFVERGVQDCRIRRLPKGLLCAVCDADNRASPSSSILRIATDFPPENLAGFRRDLSWKSGPQLHESVTNKLLPLRIAQNAAC
jgi:hypothetical protein